MKTIALVSLMVIAFGHAKPVARQSQVCNAAPAGTNSGNAPLSQPTAATAAACQQQCDANPQCLSFTFGLPASATSPQCKIFGVAAAQVPAQSDPNIMVFDKACSSVPSTAPTSSAGSGNTNSKVNPASTTVGGNINTPAQGNGGNGNAQPRDLQERQTPQPPQGNANPPPPPPPGKTPDSQPRSLQERQTQPPRGNNRNANRPPAQGNNANRNTQNRGVTGTANPPPQNNGNGQQVPPSPPSPQGQNRKRSNTCGVAPAGPAGSAPTPIQTLTTIQTQDECLALCKQTTGCQSIEFGQPSADRRECQLFNAPAASLPPAENGETLIAFDVGC